MAVPMANDPPFATLNHFAADLGIPSESDLLRTGISGSSVTPFPHPAHRSGHADFPHPALGQDITPSPTARRAQAQSGGRARSTRTGARVDRSRPCVA